MKVSYQLHLLLSISLLTLGCSTVLYANEISRSTGVGNFTLLETISGILTTILTVISLFFKNKSDKKQVKIDQILQLAGLAIDALKDKTLTKDEINELITKYKGLKG